VLVSAPELEALASIADEAVHLEHATGHVLDAIRHVRDLERVEARARPLLSRCLALRQLLQEWECDAEIRPLAAVIEEALEAQSAALAVAWRLLLRAQRSESVRVRCQQIQIPPPAERVLRRAARDLRGRATHP
jgi:hypothetical protein